VVRGDFRHREPVFDLVKNYVGNLGKHPVARCRAIGRKLVASDIEQEYFRAESPLEKQPGGAERIGTVVAGPGKNHCRFV